MRFLLTIVFSFAIILTQGQSPAHKWVDSVYHSLSKEERIAQLMVVRLSELDTKSGKVTYYDQKVLEWINKYNIGGILIFQGNPDKQAEMINQIIKAAKTPVMFSIDGEWGLAQRMPDSIMALPKPMMLGAMRDSSLMYDYGKLVAEQCKRLNIHMNYAPVIDVNNNPDNPVINDRSFGEDKNKVAAFGIQYMRGMQDNGVMACAKHFPGHGDVSVDSHLDLPIINKSLSQLKQLELFPFEQLFRAGVASVMVAHLFIPSIDATPNTPTSVSSKAIEQLLQKDLHYEGLVITDGLEMQGVQKFFPKGKAAAAALIAGNDILCLPGEVPDAMDAIKTAIKEKKLHWHDIEKKCKKVLMAKYNYVLSGNNEITNNNLVYNLNRGIAEMRTLVAQQAITLIAKTNNDFFPLSIGRKVAYVGIGINNDNEFAKLFRSKFNAEIFYLDLSGNSLQKINILLEELKRFDQVVVGIHNTKRTPAGNFGIGKDVVSFYNSLQAQNKVMGFLFGNAYAARNWCNAQNFAVAYEDDFIVQQVAMEMLLGTSPFKGVLPVTVCKQFSYGFGITSYTDKKKAMP